MEVERAEVLLIDSILIDSVPPTERRARWRSAEGREGSAEDASGSSQKDARRLPRESPSEAVISAHCGCAFE